MALYFRFCGRTNDVKKVKRVITYLFMGNPKSKCTFMGLTALCECEDKTLYVLPYKTFYFLVIIHSTMKRIVMSD